MIVHTKKLLVIIAIIIFLILAIGSIYFYFFKKPQMLTEKPSHPICLSDNETVIYNIDRKQYIGPVEIIIKDKNSKKEISRFIVENVSSGYYPVQPRKCGVYIMKEFNWDYKKFKPLPGFCVELWKYNYNGEGTPLLTFAGENKQGQPVIYYDYDFRIDFIEIYIALIQGYLGKIDNYATIIKELETKKDIFKLDYENIINQYPEMAGDFQFDEWTRESRYFWGHLSYGANVLGFFRIERDTWKVDILPAPQGTLGGTAFNPEYGYITYDTGPGWIGIEEIAQQVYEEWQKAGKIKEFYLYNLFTKEKILLATTTDPSWPFQSKSNWISDTELEYELPTGEKKIYKINDQ